MYRESEKIISIPLDRIKGMVPSGAIDFLWPKQKITQGFLQKTQNFLEAKNRFSSIPGKCYFA